MRDGLYIDSDGNRKWYLNGHLHRADGPACEYADGYRSWYLNGSRHRADGPAREWADGYREWWLNNIHYSFSEYLEVRFLEDCPERTLFLLKWVE